MKKGFIGAKGMFSTGNGSGGSPIRPITQTPIELDGTIQNIPIDDTVKIFLFDDLVSAQAFTISGLSDTEEHTVRRILDNSANTSAISLTWPTSLIWDDSVPETGLSGIAAGAKYILEIEVAPYTGKAYAYIIPLNS